jgi:hypothetical protein
MRIVVQQRMEWKGVDVLFCAIVINKAPHDDIDCNLITYLIIYSLLPFLYGLFFLLHESKCIMFLFERSWHLHFLSECIPFFVWLFPFNHTAGPKDTPIELVQEKTYDEKAGVGMPDL